MPLPQEIKFEFKVFYKPNPHYKGDYNTDIKPGLHGVFDTVIDARRAATACRRWFNEENINTPKSVNGVTVPDVATTNHDNVIVWVEEYQDGMLVKNGKHEKELALVE